MTFLPFPFLISLFLIPLGAASAVGQAHRPRSARAIALISALATMLIAFALAIHGSYAPGQHLADPLLWSSLGDPRPVFLLDGIGRVAVPLIALLGFVTILAPPPTEPVIPTARDQLVYLGATMLVYLSADLGVLAVAWLATLVPILRSVGRSKSRGRWRLTAISLFGGWALLVGGLSLVVLEASRAGLAAPCYLPELIATESARAAGAFTLLLLAALVREGLLPFQSWVLILVEDASPGLAGLTIASHSGAALLARVALPLFPTFAQQHLLSLDELGLITAVLASLAAVSPRRPQRAFAWVAISQSALLMMGLVCQNHLGVTGSLVQWVALGLSLTGMLLGLWMAEARTGRSDMRRFGGLVTGAPSLAGTFVLFTFASVGLPMTLGFVGEDLLFHGVLETVPWIGFGMVLVTALNGVTGYRIFARVFLGPPPPSPVADLRRSERLALGALALALVVAGLWPARLVSDRASPAEALAAATAHQRPSTGGPTSH